MIVVTGYISKKDLKTRIGSKLIYRETSLHGAEFKRDGTFPVAHRPALGFQPKGREFFAEVTMKDGVIAKVI